MADWKNAAAPPMGLTTVPGQELAPRGPGPGFPMLHTVQADEDTSGLKSLLEREREREKLHYVHSASLAYECLTLSFQCPFPGYGC